MIRRRLEALERLPRRGRPTCQCLLAFCPQMDEERPPVEVVCSWCGLWRDPQTAQYLEEIIVESRADVEASLATPRRQEQ
ncbi:MAG TPA: hypothetical protein VH643_07955 [Gemmataceae bacterium]